MATAVAGILGYGCTSDYPHWDSSGMSGVVRYLKDYPDLDEATPVNLPHALLGAADLGTASTRQMTLRCLDDCVACTIRFERFNELVLRFPELALAIIRALSVRLRWVAELALTLETQSTRQRLCTVLLTLSERFGAQHGDGVLIDLHLTNEDLAAIAGLTRQFVNSTLQDLRKRGLLLVEGRQLVVPNRSALAALLEGG